MKKLMTLFLPLLCVFALAARGQDEEPVDDEALEASSEEAGEEDGEEKDGEEGEMAASPIYIPLQPQFVVNYGGPGKLKYLRTGVTVRLASAHAANSVRHHLPYIRNNLVMLFAAQTDETLQSQDGREAMRLAALAEVRELLQNEDGLEPENVVDLLFNSLTWH